MKRNRGSLVTDLEAQQWSCWTLEDRRIVANHQKIEGSDGYIGLPVNTGTVLSNMHALVTNDPAVHVVTCISSPSRMATYLGIDDMEFAEHYGYGDSGLNYGLVLYAVFTGVDE